MNARSQRSQRNAVFVTLLAPVRALFALLVATAASVATAAPQAPKSGISTASHAVVNQHPDTAKTREEWRRAMLRLPKPKAGCYTSAFPVIQWIEAPCGEAPRYPIASAQGKPVQQPDLRAWRTSLLRLPRRAPGCYTAAFPAVEWKAVACGPAPLYPIMPKHGRARPFTIGSTSGDRAAHPTGTISAVEGSFINVSAGLTESGPIANTPPSIADTYTLQINTNPFTSATACTGSTNPGCQGWEQFVYENNNVSHRAFIQYWLLQFNANCPAGWTPFSFMGNTVIHCFRSTTTASLPAGVPVSSFSTLSMSASVTATSDQVVVTAGGNAATRVGINAVAAAAGWTDSEFNVFGDGGNNMGGGTATFGANSTMTVKQVVHNGTTNAPPCVTESFTGEMNNLTIVGAPTITTQPAPTIEFTQSNIPGTPAGCASAAGIGDTHLSTFGGLFYDFQASGDFVLAQTDTNFVVQARQVSGAPTWPNASVNKAVAARMGSTRVAVCTVPERLLIDGKSTVIENGGTLSLPGGVDLLHRGNVYVAVDSNGNSMRAEVNGNYINVSVGLGRWPTDVHGVLANVTGQANKIQARTGMVLTSPFPFDQLYHQYADSWRVSAQESVLSDCGGQGLQVGIPTRPFYAKDLNPRDYERARAVCTRAGVKTKTLLDACTLDVVVIGTDSAANVFVRERRPTAVGLVVPGRGDQDRYKKR